MCDLYDKDNFFTDLLLIIKHKFLFSFNLTDTFFTPEPGERQKKPLRYYNEAALKP